MKKTSENTFFIRTRSGEEKRFKSYKDLKMKAYDKNTFLSLLTQTEKGMRFKKYGIMMNAITKHNINLKKKSDSKDSSKSSTSSKKSTSSKSSTSKKLEGVINSLKIVAFNEKIKTQDRLDTLIAILKSI